MSEDDLDRIARTCGILRNRLPNDDAVLICAMDQKMKDDLKEQAGGAAYGTVSSEGHIEALVAIVNLRSVLGLVADLVQEMRVARMAGWGGNPNNN